MTTTLRNRGFDISGVERNSNGDVKAADLRRQILAFLLLSANANSGQRFTALENSARSAGVEFDSRIFRSPKKRDRVNLARWTGYSEKELWPYASTFGIERARLQIALAEAATTAEPLDPISPLPDLSPPADLKWPVREGGPFEQPTYRTLPPPTASWMGDLHRAFGASPADTANAALRKRVAELEAQLASSVRSDAYYNGGGMSHADQMAANEAAYLSQRRERPTATARAPFIMPDHPRGMIHLAMDFVDAIRRLTRRFRPISHLRMLLPDLEEYGLRRQQVLCDMETPTLWHKGQRALWSVLIGVQGNEAEAMSAGDPPSPPASTPRQTSRVASKAFQPIEAHLRASKGTADAGCCVEALSGAPLSSPLCLEGPEAHRQSPETALRICTCGNPSVDSLKSDRADFMVEMAAWPPVYEDRGTAALRRFVNCLRESASRLVGKSARA